MCRVGEGVRIGSECVRWQVRGCFLRNGYLNRGVWPRARRVTFRVVRLSYTIVGFDAPRYWQVGDISRLIVTRRIPCVIERDTFAYACGMYDDISGNDTLGQLA
jgi:hypothetical protein